MRNSHAIFLCFTAISTLAQVSPPAPDAAREFEQAIRPVLLQNCASCHNPAAERGPAPFLKAATVTEMEANRSLWRNVAAQLRNRTMPPRDSKLTEEDRVRLSSWIDNQLRRTACTVGDYAGPAITRRLNRREYHNTIRDLLGVDFEVTAMLPADGTGGAGFDTNGETLYIPPILMERYMEAAQSILDRVIITPPLSKMFTVGEVQSAGSDQEFSASVPVYIEGAYDVQAAFEGGSAETRLTLKVDGADVGFLAVRPRRIVAGKPASGPSSARLQINLTRGSHRLSVVPSEPAARLMRVSIAQKQDPALPEKRALHYHLFGMEPGEQPLKPRKAARQILEWFVPKAFRRPVEPAEIDRFLTMYDRAAERGDPYEERVKLALKTVLVWPEFLFRIEQKRAEPGLFPLSQYELASRLSYFLWSTAPDDKLLRLAEEGRLQDTRVLAAQVDRMLDDPRSRTFLNSFTGQWLGTQDIGGRVVPLLTELQSFYTPETAADLRAQPVLLLDRIVSEDRSLLELLTADYTHLTQRLAKFYQIEDQVKGLSDTEFQLVKWPDNRRAGILGLGGILAMTSRYKETSPVLRGAWALDTLLGTPVPPPPPDVPELKPADEAGGKLRMRERLMQHRADSACAACHRLMDPIGFGLENFDWMGRWRDQEDDGSPIDATGELPSGEKFNGPVELRQALLSRKQDFIGNITARMLGYALGRSLQDGDDCTVHRIVQTLEQDDYRARTLIREIVLSLPFRNSQGGVVQTEPLISRRSLDISKLNALKQDAASHNNQVKLRPNAAPPKP
jgi:mono/diheme cytochrome c family protein